MTQSKYDRYQYLFKETKQELLKRGYRYYDTAGIYCIMIDYHIVYIGKSRNMLDRLVEHILCFRKPKERKYQILSEAKAAGHYVSFCPLLYIDWNCSNDYLLAKEGEFIRAHLPPLNYQIPKEDNPHNYTVNPAARTITLQEIIENFEGEK